MKSLISLLAIALPLSNNIEALKKEEYCSLTHKKPIVATKILNDYNDHSFKSYELDGGYAIYQLLDDREEFIEGSLETNSPYFNHLDSNLLYFGPGEYLFKENGKDKQCLTNKIVSSYKEGKASYELVIKDQPLRVQTAFSYIDEGDFTYINHPEYFKKLSAFPNNWFGECGLIALSMLLSYYDTLYNDSFIPNSITYPSREYNTTGAITSSTMESLIHKVEFPNINTTSYPMEYWPDMPGTNKSMRDYLFDNYIHTYMNIGSPSAGYPMNDGELKNTFKDYMNANAQSLMSDIQIRSGNVFYTHQRPKQYIDQGDPVIIDMTKYYMTAQGEPYTEERNHNAVAYGYITQGGKDYFIANMGWYPGSLSYSKTIIADPTIYGYFSIHYSGQHIHSKNAYMYGEHEQYGICGCGHVSAM